MSTLKKSSNSNRWIQKIATYLAAVATVGVLALGAASLFTPVHADSPRGSRDDRDDREPRELRELVQGADVAELDQILADFHGALSYGGDITAMMKLWAPNSSLTFNGTTYNGNAAVQSFFTSGGYFHNNWASLAPEFKTQVAVHGNRAELSTQCVAIDLSVTPNVVKAVIQVNATAVRHDGKWLFTSMNNTSPAPL